MDPLIPELKRQIIERLNLEDVAPEDLDEAAPLFGEGLGLDSIDALELVVMLESLYGIKITEREEGTQAFRSVNSLAQFIRERQAGCEENG